jgi:hypothetical protein
MEPRHPDDRGGGGTREGASEGCERHPDGYGFPFRLRRKPILVQHAFAMKINKAQGQTVQNMGLYLAMPCFSRVALSCVTRVFQGAKGDVEKEVS